MKRSVSGPLLLKHQQHKHRVAQAAAPFWPACNDPSIDARLAQVHYDQTGCRCGLHDIPDFMNDAPDPAFFPTCPELNGGSRQPLHFRMNPGNKGVPSGHEDASYLRKKPGYALNVIHDQPAEDPIKDLLMKWQVLDRGLNPCDRDVLHSETGSRKHGVRQIEADQPAIGSGDLSKIATGPASKIQDSRP